MPHVGQVGEVKAAGGVVVVIVVVKAVKCEPVDLAAQ